MKRKKLLLSMLLSAVAVFTVHLVPVLANDVSVYLNGQLLTYTGGAAPFIIDGRTMVPFRDTANYMGMVIGWDEGTQTMTLTKDNTTMVHTINNSFIVLNGQVKTYDVPSQVVNGRTVMPVMMLADALGAKAEWDGRTYTVTITTVANDPAVISAYPSKTTLTPDEQITVTVTANKATTNVQLRGSDFATLAENSAYIEAGENRTFTVPYKPTTTGTQRITVYASNGTLLGGDTQEFTLTIAEDMEIKSISANNSSVNTNRNVTITVTTNDGVDRVKLENDYDSDVKESSSYRTNGSNREFTFTVTSSRARTIRYTAIAGNSSGNYSSNINKTIDIKYGSGSSSSSSKEVDVSVANSGSSSKRVTVTTYDDVERVEIQTTGGNVVTYATRSNSSSGNRLTWSLTVNNSEINSSSTYYVYAYTDLRNDEYYDRVSFNFGDVNIDSSKYVYNITTNPSYTNTYYAKDERIVVTFSTDAELRSAILLDPDGNEVSLDLNFSYNSSDGTWSGRFRISKSGKYVIQVTDYNGNTHKSSDIRFTLLEDS